MVTVTKQGLFLSENHHALYAQTTEARKALLPQYLDQKLLA